MCANGVICDAAITQADIMAHSVSGEHNDTNEHYARIKPDQKIDGGSIRIAV
jgi:hypothetical protein